MKRRYKLLLIITFGALLTIIINHFSVASKISFVALGDGLSLGVTPYSLVGPSYNDYLKDNLIENNKLENYNFDFCLKHFKLDEINIMLEKNYVGKSKQKPIKQILASADLITIAFGEDELADISLKTKITKEYIENFINSYELLINNIRSFNDKQIIIVGLYPAFNMDKNTVITINEQLSKLAVKYKTNFLDILPVSLNNSYYLQSTSYYMSYKAHQVIANLIEKELMN
ncbi:MAG: hypothetical protein RR478_02895 [Bacilli bacterium]